MKLTLLIITLIGFSNVSAADSKVLYSCQGFSTIDGRPASGQTDTKRIISIGDDTNTVYLERSVNGHSDLYKLTKIYDQKGTRIYDSEFYNVTILSNGDAVLIAKWIQFFSNCSAQ